MERLLSCKKRGIVYLIRCDGKRYYKIGVTKQLEKRLNTIETCCPFHIVLTAWAETTTPYDLESYLHGSYAAKRIKGEWFLLDDCDVAAIRHTLKASVL